MDSVFGLVGDGYAILAADATSSRSILVFQHDLDKIVQLDENKILACSGVAADSSNFSEYIQKNMKLYQLDNDMALNNSATANYIRGELAKALRKAPFQTNVLFAGYDKLEELPSLYFIDYMGSLAKMNFGAHGYAANFILSVFDREWQRGLTIEQGIDVVKKCINELRTRFLIAQPKFTIKIVDKDGVRPIEI